MSWKLSGIVKGLSHTPSGRKLTANEKLFLLILADYSNEATGTSWPSVARLAAESLCSERTLQRMIARMASAGFLEVERRPGLSSRYTLVLEHPNNLFTPQTDIVAPVTVAPVSPESHPTPATKVTPEPSLNRKESKTPLTPASGGEESSFVWCQEQIAVRMGRRRRLPNLGSFDGARAEQVVAFLNGRGFPARVMR